MASATAWAANVWHDTTAEAGDTKAPKIAAAPAKMIKDLDIDTPRARQTGEATRQTAAYKIPKSGRNDETLAGADLARISGGTDAA